MPLPRFILNDQRVKNSHGFYLLNAGGRFDRFLANPVMLDNHDPDRLIGRWEDLAVEGDLLTAVPIFDEGTELGRERKGQVERGFLKGASIGLYIHAAEYRMNPATGENELYVTEWEQIESSTTALPSNAGALTLKIYDQGRQPVPEERLAAYLDSIVRLTTINEKMPTINQNGGGGAPAPASVSLTAAAQVALGLSGTPDSAAISAAVVELSARYEQEKAAREKLETEAAAAREQATREMIALAVREGRITADQQANYEKLAAADYETTKAALEALPTKASLSAQVKGAAGGSGIPAERKAWNLHAWMKEDMPGLRKLKTDDPEAYAEILKRV